MDGLLNAIKDWPVIVQGALGSALFSLLIVAGQRATTYFSTRLTSISKSRKSNRLTNQIIRLEALNSSNDAESAFLAAILWIRASRSVIKALMWLTLGMFFGSFLSTLGIVGFLGCFYYLFAALEIVKPIIYEGDIAAKIHELKQERSAIDGDV